MNVKEVMSKKVISVKLSTTLKQLLEKFNTFHMFPLVPVVDDHDHLLGVISFRNLINVFLAQRPAILRTIPFIDEEDENIFKSDLNEGIGDLLIVEDIMETKFVSIMEEATLEEAYNTMKLYLKEDFPVVDKSGKLVGMIGIFDIIREIFRQKGVL